MKLYKKIIFKGKITLLSGLHIGAGKDSIEIGGVDAPVVRKKDGTMEPYIPGSSIKGKIRSLLEISAGITGPDKSHGKPVGNLFGNIPSGEVKSSNASRIIVRDSYLTTESKNKLLNSTNTDLPYTEVKAETAIDRVAGSAKNGSLRLRERIPAGAVFEVEFVINVVGDSESNASANEKEFLDTFKKGVALLNDDYLGGSGSRGYGNIRIDLDSPLVKEISSY